MKADTAKSDFNPRPSDSKVLSAWVFALCALVIGGCEPSFVQPEDLRLTQETLAKRQAQTRVFDTDDEGGVLAASAAALRDIGFLIDESELQLGLIVGSKERSAINPAQVAVMIAVAILAGDSRAAVGDERQTMRASLVTTPVREGKGIAVRVTFQRIVFTNQGGVSKRQALGSDEIYQEFFATLSKALYLGAQAP